MLKPKIGDTLYAIAHPYERYVIVDLALDGRMMLQRVGSPLVRYTSNYTVSEIHRSPYRVELGSALEDADGAETQSG